MGWFFGGRGPQTLNPPLRPQVEAWTDRSILEPIDFVLNDLFGLESLPATRAEAMTVPAIARARLLLCTTIARLPLIGFRGPDRLTDDSQPAWCYRTNHQVPHQRTLWTVDDLIFYGTSLWHAVDTDSDDFPLVMDRVPWNMWEFGDAGQIIDADGQPYPDGRTILIEGPHEGILSFGGRTIRSAAALEQTVASVAAHPFRLELHQVSGDQMDRADRQQLIAATRQALRDNEGILFTNQAIESKELGAGGSQQLLVEGRNASAVDAARLVGIPAAMIDATSAGSSLTYETTSGRNAEFWDYGVTAYAEPIAARLSMDDVVPRGQRVEFDAAEVTTLAPSTTGYPAQD